MTPFPLGTYNAALAYLARFTDYERAHRVLLGNSMFRLRRLARVLRALGHPQRALPVVHVTGSKGKGSTSVMIAELARAHGLRVGLYTSPHLQDMRERIQVDGVPIPQEDFVRGLEVVLGAALARPEDRELVVRGRGDGPLPDRFPTYFELLTALAFVHFRRCDADLAVVEVGLGGRLDATNLVRAPVAVITRIELEHTEVLGSTLEAIAGEKAGIVKRGVRHVILGERGLPARLKIGRRCAAFRIVPRRLGRDMRAWGRLIAHEPEPGQSLHLTLGRRVFRDVFLPVIGAHQADNAAVALAATHALALRGLLRLGPREVCAGFAAVRLPGRLQVLRTRIGRRERPVLLDGCHTADSAQGLRDAVQAWWPAARRWLVFGALQGKSIEAMLDILAPAFDRILFTPVASTRSWTPFERPDVAREPGLRPALDRAFAHAGSWDLLVVAGSLYLAGEALDVLESGKRMVPEART